MHHDIKTFSQLTAIDTKRQLIVDLRVCKHGQTVSYVKLNGFIINVDTIEFQFDLCDSVKLEIELLDFDEGSSGVEVEYLGINGIDVLPKYKHLSTDGGCYIDKLGMWAFDIPKNFYAWYQQISGGSEILNIGVIQSAHDTETTQSRN